MQNVDLQPLKHVHMEQPKQQPITFNYWYHQARNQMVYTNNKNIHTECKKSQVHSSQCLHHYILHT